MIFYNQTIKIFNDKDIEYKISFITITENKCNDEAPFSEARSIILGYLGLRFTGF